LILPEVALTDQKKIRAIPSFSSAELHILAYMAKLFLWLDSSTQSLSALVIDLDSRKVVYGKNAGVGAAGLCLNFRF
jgi:hypothetical protein